MMKKRLLALTLGLSVVAALLIGSVLLKDAEAESGEINYQMTWIWGEATATESGWQVENDLGFIVTVEEGYLISHTLQLLPCEDVEEEENAGLLNTVFGANTVEAGHGGDENDPSAILIPQVESLAVANTITFGSVTVPHTEYCTAHYLVARSDSVTLNMPENVDMYGLSLYVSGTYQKADSDETVAFILQTSLANGKIADIRDETDGEPVRVEITNDIVQVEVQRQLDTLFDGVDFETMDSDEQARTVLWSLIQDTQVLVTKGKIG